MSTSFSTDRPLRIAVVGSGPSGFYAAESLFKSDIPVAVNMFDRLPTPFGLVRGGVAPDHQKIKNVVKVFDRTASRDGFAFWGNVTIGDDLTVAELKSYHDAVIFASGAETDRQLGIPGEDLDGSHTATEFVGWYNGHPDYRACTFDLSGETAVVIGQGNVAVDVVRILAKTVDELRETDIAQHALDALSESRIKSIYMVGRRGPVQGAFTDKEIRELGELADCDPIVSPADLELNPASEVELETPGSVRSQRNLPILREMASRSPPSKSKRLHIVFFRSPTELIGSGSVEKVVLETNELTGEPGSQKARGTGVTEELPCDLIFRSVGYRGVPMEGMPFDERKGVFPNVDGRVSGNGLPEPGIYAAGWIKRGPSGVIGTNKPDSEATVKSLLDDVDKLPMAETADDDAMRAVLADRGVRVVTYADWRRIDAAEIARGEAVGKPREKFTTVPEMLAVLDA